MADVTLPACEHQNPPGYPLQTWQTIAATFGTWILGGLLFNGARS